MNKFTGAVYTVIGAQVSSKELHAKFADDLHQDGPFWYIKNHPHILVINDGRGISYVCTLIKDETMNWGLHHGHIPTVIYKNAEWNMEHVEEALGPLFKEGTFGVWTILVDDPVVLWSLSSEHKIRNLLCEEGRDLEVPPNDKAATNAYIIRALLVHYGHTICTATLAPDADGGINFHWSKGERKARICCYNDGKINLVLREKPEAELTVLPLDGSDYGIDHGIAKLYEFLGEEKA